MTNLEDLIRPYTDQLEITSHQPICQPTFIPIKVGGGVGDVIMTIDALKFMSERYNVAIYTPHIEAIEYFYPEVKALKYPQNFSWFLDFDTIVKFRFRDGFSGFLMDDQKALFDQQQLFFERHPALRTLATTHTEKYFLVSRYAKAMGLTRSTFPLHSLGFT